MLSQAQLSAMSDEELQKEFDNRKKAQTKVPPTFSAISGQTGQELEDIEKEQRKRKIDKILDEPGNNPSK